jgi:DMSO/TMAO reductase YedYZ molybdopterin-dependent catalytic subunit
MIVKMAPEGFFKRISLEPHHMLERITPGHEVIVLCHLGVPHIEAKDWSLTIDGLVKRQTRLSFSDLRRYRFVEVESIHECAGSPLQPEVPTRRASNVVWGGVRLADILGDCGLEPSASFIWSYGADFGSFSGVTVPSFVKDLPLSRLAADVLVATGMNGAPLPRENGFPARLVVPGFYGTNSVKWLTRLTLADKRAESPFTTQWYNDPIRDVDGSVMGTKPVWALAPKSVIVSPPPSSSFARGEQIEVWGWAWSDPGIARVEVRAGAGGGWIEAAVEERRGRAWQRFVAPMVAAYSGRQALTVRAWNDDGTCQPETGARNAWHSVSITVI